MQLLITALIISLQLTAIHVTTWRGMIFARPAEILATLFDKIYGKKGSKLIQKPLWDCLPCMSGFWTIMLTGRFDIKLILVVCGMCVLIDCALPFSNHDPERV